MPVIIRLRAPIPMAVRMNQPSWRVFPKGDLFRTTGESIADDTAFIVGAATNNPQLQAAAAGMQEATARQAGSQAVVGLITLRKGEEVGPEFSAPAEKAIAQGPRYAKSDLRQQV